MGRLILREKTAADYALIEQAIIKHFILANLGHDVRRLVMDKMDLYEFDEDAVIFKQDDHATYFYVVLQGVLEVHINGRKIKEIYRGDSFGELALITDAPRSATISCV